VRQTREGEIRWTTWSIFHGEERWRSEGIQVGGIKSARGVLGNWFDKDYDLHGPAGPTSFWKLTDEIIDDYTLDGLDGMLPTFWNFGRGGGDSSDDDDENDQDELDEDEDDDGDEELLEEEEEDQEEEDQEEEDQEEEDQEEEDQEKEDQEQEEEEDVLNEELVDGVHEVDTVLTSTREIWYEDV